jgi:hypothetical protein
VNTSVSYRMVVVGMAVLALAASLVVVAPSFAETPAVEPVATSEPSDDEIAGLFYMREEEKLAHDVYQVLNEKWDLRTFDNIAASEQRHMDAVQMLLDSHGLTDPAAGLKVGEFSDPELQALYDQLVEQGTKSLVDALLVGAAIEEIDISDLARYSAQTETVDIQQVYGYLMRGSENHLRAFVRNVDRQTGDSYQPSYLSQAEFDEIVSARMGYGRGQGQGQGKGQGQGRGQGRGQGQGQCQGDCGCWAR